MSMMPTDLLRSMPHPMPRTRRRWPDVNCILSPIASGWPTPSDRFDGIGNAYHHHDELACIPSTAAFAFDILTYARPCVSYSVAFLRTIAGLGSGHRLACHVLALVRTHPVSTMCTGCYILLNTRVIMSDIPMIIIPFRDRYKHLVHWMCSVRHRLPRRTVVIVVEQRDQNKFNRGALLNAGFIRAEQLGATRVIFHDVDLVPDNDLIDMYVRKWPTPVVHFGCRFNRYNNTNSYFGGVVGFDTFYFPGFSNLFYGWGGEDDSLYRRTEKRLITRPQQGTYHDMEGYCTPQQKLKSMSAKHKCANKRELIASDDVRNDNHRTLRCIMRYDRKYDCEWLLVTLQKSSKCRRAARVMHRIRPHQSCVAGPLEK